MNSVEFILNEIRKNIRKNYRGKFLKISINTGAYFGFFVTCYILPEKWNAIKESFLKFCDVHYYNVLRLNENDCYIEKQRYDQMVTFEIRTKKY